MGELRSASRLPNAAVMDRSSPPFCTLRFRLHALLCSVLFSSLHFTSINHFCYGYYVQFNASFLNAAHAFAVVLSCDAGYMSRQWITNDAVVPIPVADYPETTTSHCAMDSIHLRPEQAIVSSHCRFRIGPYHIEVRMLVGPIH